MNIILLSGGSGKRLWPLSNEARSKQFLKLLKDKSNDNQSMVQRVFGQIHDARLKSNVVIATSKGQEDSLKNQLSEYIYDVIIEPERRDTFPAIILSVMYLYYTKKCDAEDTVITMPVDPYVEETYFNTFKELEYILQKENINIALMGVKPTYPSAKYGYIIPENDTGNKFNKVKGFKEKPTEEKAEELISKGAMWNCGVFAFKIKYILELTKKYINFNSYEDVLNNYSKLKKISFDYEVVEKEKNVGVVKYEGIWKDLGTWNTLTEHIEDKTIGKALLSADSENTHVINELDIPVVVIGINNAVVAVSPDGILISDKKGSSKLKEYLVNMNQRPMYEEKRWGKYAVLDYLLQENGTKTLIKKLTLNKDKNLSYQQHYKRKEIWTIVSGEGTVIINEDVKTVKSGDILTIEKMDKHSLKAETELEFIEIQMGEELEEEDILRFEYEWEKIIEIRLE